MTERHDVTILVFGTDQSRDVIQREFKKGVRNVIVVPPPPVYNGRLKRWGQLSAILQGRSSTSLEYHSREMQAAVEQILAHDRFDLVQMENYPLGSYRMADHGAVHVLDAQNVEFDSAHRAAIASPSSLRRWFYDREAKSIRREEVDVYRRQDAILVTSERDRTLLDTHVPDVAKFVIPNGVDPHYYCEGSESVEPDTLVFTGSMNYYPNVDAMHYFLGDIFPRIRRELGKVKISIVGIGPPKSLLRLRSESVIVTGKVADVRPHISRAAVYVVPLRMGGGTRLKVLEALAMRKPVVTTSVGCEGIDVRHNDSVLIADDPASFASSVVELLRNREAAARLKEVGYHLVRLNYSWSAIGEKLEEAYRSLVAGRRRAPDR
jgi:glycosyltransferase involved in cell wall biosynthesis